MIGSERINQRFHLRLCHDAFRRLEAIHNTHIDIHQNQVKAALLASLQGRESIFSRLDSELLAEVHL